MKKGILMMFISATCFALATLFAKKVTNGSDIKAVEITFFRFALGFLLACFYIKKSKVSLVPNKKRYVIIRIFTNTIAVILFFTAVEHTTITNANMLNMTYPVFVFMLAPFINKEKILPEKYVYLVLCLIGVYLVVVPDFSLIKMGDVIAVLSAIIAGLSVSILREARKYDSTTVILFYLMGVGTIINFILMYPFFIMPDSSNIVLILLSAASGVMGQVAITLGYKYIDAAAGAIISSSRIIIAAILGIIFFSEQLMPNTVWGGIFILASLIGVAGGFRMIYSKYFSGA